MRLGKPARGRASVLLAVAFALLAWPDRVAFAPDDPAAQSVEELKAALAELRRRLAAQQAMGTEGEPEPRLRAVQQQMERLAASMNALRLERDGLRGELVTVRAERERLLLAEARQRRQLEQAQAEIDLLRQKLERAAAPPPPPLEALAPPAPVSEVIDGSAFAPGSAELRPEAVPRLDAIAVRLSTYPARAVRIVGYTDASGGAADNRLLSLARAEAIRARLLQLVPAKPGRLLVEGRGEADPVASNDTPEGRIANRRVVVTIEP